MAARAAGLHLGLIIALEMCNFCNDRCQFGNLDISALFVRERDMIRRASKINQERWTVKIFALGQIVEEVKNHPRPLHERQAENGVDGDVRTCCDQE